MDIICVAFPPWEGNYVKSTVELMKHMAPRERILYVDYSFTYKDLILGLFKKTPTPVKRLLGLQNRIREVKGVNDSVLWILTTPPIFPVNFLKNEYLYNWIRKRNAAIIRRSILKAEKKIGFHSPVVVNAFNPTIGMYLLKKLREKYTVYYCYDEFSSVKWSQKHGSRVEIPFLAAVDATIVSSKILFETKSPNTRQCFLVENGVDYNLFKTGYTPSKGNEVIIGYTGTIDNRFDMLIIETIVKRFPEAKLVLVGRVKPYFEEIIQRLTENFSNVIHIGALPAEALPEWLGRFHIGIIPFIKNKQTAAIYPMKINEYLAAGIPVVTTDFAPLEGFGEAISIASSPNEFVDCIERELASDNREKQMLRQSIAKQNSWENRALLFEKVLESV
jgi:glycosyltransferase involved in cell wall biosynthesis